MSIRFHLFETALGSFGIAWSQAGLVALQLAEADQAQTRARLSRRQPGAIEAEASNETEEIVERIRRYAEGERIGFNDVPLDLSAISAGDRVIYEHLRGFGYGRLTTYGALAQACRAPGGARGVGQAMGRNPVPLIIPCHRVVGTDGRLVGFSAHGGTQTKARMLRMEDARLDLVPEQGQLAF